jgi:uncharacterized short protein YbdD (DUF466 family)
MPQSTLPDIGREKYWPFAEALVCRAQNLFRVLFMGIREWCGDRAYDRYLEAHRSRQSKPVLSRDEFYVEQLNRRYSRPNRCC